MGLASLHSIQQGRNLALADAIVQRTLDIIMDLSPWAWIVENPDTGLLKTRWFMRTLPVLGVIDYCQYGYQYRKRTRLWGSCPDLGLLPPCKKETRHAVVNGRHLLSAQRGTSRGNSTDRAMTVSELYRIPRALCRDISYAATRLMLWGPGHVVRPKSAMDGARDEPLLEMVETLMHLWSGPLAGMQSL